MSLCAVVVLGAVASSQPGAGVLYAKVGWGHSCSPGVGCTSYYREADIDQAAFDVDPTSTTATLSTTVDGCHLELGLQASPAGPTDGYTTTPWLAKDAQPSVGAGAAVLRLLFASGSGSVCNDSLGQGPVKASFIGRVQAASAIVGSDYNYGDNILADALKAVTSRAGG